MSFPSACPEITCVCEVEVVASASEVVFIAPDGTAIPLIPSGPEEAHKAAEALRHAAALLDSAFTH